MALNPNGRTAKVKAQIQMSGVVLVIHPYEDGKGFSLNIYSADGPIRDFDFDEHGDNVGAGTAFSGSLDDVDGVEPGGWAAADFNRCPNCQSVSIAYHSDDVDLPSGERHLTDWAVCTAREAKFNERENILPPVPKTPEDIARMLGGLAEATGYGTGESHRIESTPDGPLTTTYDYQGNIVVEDDEELPDV